MIIFPAIDIHNGQCVRLLRGDYSTAERVADSYLDTLDSFAQAGAEWVHMVDLDGAKDAKPKNSSIFFNAAQTGKCKIEVGGGIRSMETVDYYLQNGISRVILGSAAISNPELVKQAVRKYGDKIAVGIDARDGYAAAEGWLDTSSVFYLDLAKAMEQAGVQTIIFTDISRDGTLSGPNLEQLDRLNRAVSCGIVASGGIKNLEDIQQLRQMNLYGAICGKSIYQGTLSLREAIAAAL